MCGIFGYKGVSFDASKIVLSGLKKLDYRGYDSWGIAVCTNQHLHIEKEVGKIENIDKLVLPFGKLAIGHTRWATTGSVTKINAHPFYSTDKSFAVAQNGIVENFETLKADLQKNGHNFESETDTEVIVRLIESQNNKNLVEAIRLSFLQLKGRNTIVVIDSKNNQIIAVRNGSPLIVGVKRNDFYLSSDTFSLAGFVKKYIDLDDLEMVVIKDEPLFYDAKTGNVSKKVYKKMEVVNSVVDKGKNDHFMIKEIMESGQVIKNIINSDKSKLKDLAQAIKSADHIYIIGSGTAGNAAAQMAYYLKKYTKILAISLIGADSEEYFQLFTKNDLIIAPSQSGETRDVLEVLEVAKSKGMKIVSLVNMPGSMMTRMSDYKFSSLAGPEICVMSTKVFIAQITWGYLVAKTVAGKYNQAITELNKLHNFVHNYLHNSKNIKQAKKLASQLFQIHDIFLLGKGQNFQIAKEGMIKLIEGTYKHAHAIPAGDLKHYAITLIEKNIYVLVLFSPDDSISDLNNVVNEIRSRGGTVISLPVPQLKETSAIFNVIPLQLLTYYLAVKLGNSVDKPRNIAKSVTVK